MEKCCSECPEPRVAQSLCTFCNKWLCFQCTDLHQHERPAAQPSEPRQQQTASSPPASSETGSGCCGRAVVMCPLHKHETLELFCETCDLLACSICHLSTHKDHRLVHVGKALQDQRWLLENLMARVEEKRSAVENTAKQIQGRLHSIKITQRKAENQIKMAKMIMINELNKRANLLIEQLESISSGFKNHLEDQLQGVIELCSQLEHVQNFITWAVAHHRRNPLLFSKELIALQMQQLLEPLIQSETWVPLKIKFNWDASIWTKQISTLGQLSVEGGTRSFSEGVGRPSILRPQPVPCMTMPSFCYPVRDAECAYQSCCKPQLCCLHCRPTQSVPLEKYPLTPDKYPVTFPQQPSCSNPSSHQRHWEAEGTTVSPQLTVYPSQHPSVPDPVRQSLHQTLLRQPATSDHQSHCEHISTIPDTDAVSSSETDIQPPGSTEPVHSLKHSTDQGMLQEEQAHEELPAEQPSSDSGPTVAQDQQPFITNQHMGSTGSDMLSREQECESNAESKANSKTETCKISAEPSSSSNVPYEARPPEDIQCLATVNEDQGCTAQQDYTRSKVRSCGSDITIIPLSPSSRDVSSQTTYKPEPDGVTEYSHEHNKCKTLYGTSRKHKYRKPPDGSKIPVVCLERLTVLVSKHPPLGRQRHHPPADNGQKSEGTVSLERCRQISTEEVLSEEPAQEAEEYLLPTEPSLADQQQCSISPCSSEPLVQEQLNQELSTFNTAPVHSSDPEHYLQAESEEEYTSGPKQPDNLMSAPGSVSVLESTTETDFGSEEEVDLELQAELEPSLRSEPQVESDCESDLVSEQPPELENSAESEQELISEPDSTAEVTLNLEQHEWEEEQVDTDHNMQSELSVVDQDHVEMESEDFCAVCFIGGELLCCDRCPKVFHLSCHVPALISFPVGDWVCTLCRDVQRPEVEYDCGDTRLLTDAVPSGLPACDQRKCEKLTLLIYSNILSAPFHEPVSPLARHYYQIIKRPMDLSVIRNKLNRSSLAHYGSAGEFVDDILLMFKNCAKFNYPDSEVAQAGRSLQSFFFSKLSEVFPELSRPAPNDDLDSDDYDESVCTTAVAFPWPERREQSHRKRKRRHSLNCRRHQY